MTQNYYDKALFACNVNTAQILNAVIVQPWLIACCSFPPVSSKYYISCMFCVSVAVVGFVDLSISAGCAMVLFTEHTESLKGQTQNHSAVGFFSH